MRIQHGVAGRKALLPLVYALAVFVGATEPAQAGKAMLAKSNSATRAFPPVESSGTYRSVHHRRRHVLRTKSTPAAHLITQVRGSDAIGCLALWASVPDDDALYASDPTTFGHCLRS